MTPTEYEQDVAKLIETGIKDGDHGLDPRFARVKHRPKYFSRDRERDIIFDASVEVTRRGEDEPFLYWIIECKHYSGSVPVNDAEEFFSKLQQIGGADAKGTIVAKSGFDSGTISFCRSKGIGLWRYDPNGDSMMVVQADTARERAIIHGMMPSQDTPKFFGLATTGYLANWEVNVVNCELHALQQRLSAG